VGIDREITMESEIVDVTYYWSRIPGKFLVSRAGLEIKDLPFRFSGTSKEWDETLVETVIDYINRLQHDVELDKNKVIQRQDLRVYASPSVALIFRCSTLFKPVSDVFLAQDEPIGKIADWFVYQDVTLTNDLIKVVASFKWYDGQMLKTGQIKLLDMPET